MGNRIEDKKDNCVYLFDTVEGANEFIASYFEENYTVAVANVTETEWFVYVRPIDRHKLPQSLRDLLVVCPNTF